MDEKYMKRALELSKLGEGYTSPNPLVGAVIVKDNVIIGEGYHEKYGEAHAEVNALANATEDVKDATMYVTLEPCSHYGKTPPCVNAIIQSGIKKVVIAMVDPNPIVAGRGVKILRDNHIEVITGILEKEAKINNEIFIKYITTKKPFCIMKTAMTLDGKIATKTGDSKWISNEKSRQYVHKIRHRVSAIMVGVGTVIADNPSLTTRLEDIKGVDPIRVIVDTNGRTPVDSKIFHKKSNSKTIIAVSQKVSKDVIHQFQRLGAKVIVISLKEDKIDLKSLIKHLGEMGIDSILIEGGGTLNFSALKEGIVDKIVSFIAPKIVGGSSALTPVEGEGFDKINDAVLIKDRSVTVFDDDIMIEGYIG